MKNKKIIITLITLGVLLIAYIFYLVFRSEPIVTPLDNQNLPIGNLPGFIWLLIIYGWLVYREGDGHWKDVTGELSNTVIQTITADKSGKVYAGTWGSGIWGME